MLFKLLIKNAHINILGYIIDTKYKKFWDTINMNVYNKFNVDFNCVLYFKKKLKLYNFIF